MAAKTSRPAPPYRRQKAAPHDRAYVVLNGHRIYLGRHGDPESLSRYDRVIAEWLAGGRRLPVPPDQLTVVELCAAFWIHAKSYYRKPDGSATSSLASYRNLLTRIKRLYGLMPVVNFGPGALRALRQTLIDEDWSRGSINQAMRMIRHIFRWGVSEELVPVAVHTALACLTPLRKGRGEARETAKVRPVPDAMMDAIRPHLNRQLAAMVDLQVLCGARPDEITRLRPIDIDVSGDVWIARYDEHKTDYLDLDKSILFGPRAKALLQPFMTDRRLDAYLFSPTEAEADRRNQLHVQRRTPPGYGNSPGTNRKDSPHRAAGDRYTTNTYHQALARACDKVFPPPAALARRRLAGLKGERWETQAEHRARLGEEGWRQLLQWRRKHRLCPNRLRHNAATRLRHLFGIDVAQSVVGHAMGSEITAAVYAEASLEKAKAAMRQVG